MPEIELRALKFCGIQDINVVEYPRQSINLQGILYIIGIMTDDSYKTKPSEFGDRTSFLSRSSPYPKGSYELESH